MNTRGIHVDIQQQVINELADAKIVVMAVGISGIDKVIPLLVKWLEKRKKVIDNHTLDLIMAENMRNDDEYFSNGQVKYLLENYPLAKLVGLIETNIGKMIKI